MLFRLHGPVEVHADDGRALTLRRRQERCLLAVLLLEAGRAVSVDRLCELLWDGDPPAQSRQTLRTYAARVRALLTEAGAAQHGITLIARDGGYVLEIDGDFVDIHRFRQLIDQAVGTADLSGRDRLLHDALDLWRGPRWTKRRRPGCATEYAPTSRNSTSEPSKSPWPSAWHSAATANSFPNWPASPTNGTSTNA